MDHKEFDSSLGRVAVTKSFVERQRSESDVWDDILQDFDSKDILDKAHFSRVEGIGVQPEAEIPYIKLKLDGDWRRLFFLPGEEVEDCFKTLRYRYQAYREVFE